MPLTAREDEEINTQQRAQTLGMAYSDTADITNKQVFHDILPLDQLYKLRVIPILCDNHHITFGVTNNTSQQTIQFLQQQFIDKRLDFVLISDTGFSDYMKLYDPPKEVVYKDISINNQVSETSNNSISEILEQINANDMLAYLVEQAHKLKASDIHIETQEGNARIRFRIDGVLHPVAELTVDKYRILMAAIASGGNISTSSDEAQQGHIAEKVKMADGGEVNINLRLETTPTINGMDAVMRLFNMNQDMFNLEKLGLSKDERVVVDEIIKKPSGLLLVVGPTGSGKTTTLYSILNTLSTPERKIITIEDPVEYQFPGITQISVTSKTNEESHFADKLRAVLRLDPDIIMVGEIRDNDTALTALQAALTGHLVLSTFHASSASAALTRLLNIIGQNPLFISSIRLVMAQRLVRRLDDTIKIEYTPDEATLSMINKVLITLPKEIPKPDISNLKLYKPGKSVNNPFGYSGQLAIREQFLMTGEVLKILENQKVSSNQEIEQAAINSGMRTMLQDGILKVIEGVTSIDEIYRVVG
ncbi:MAG TPA: GspE/PulE family protein [Candidatus Saccharimonadia bacterium]|nr:GspE/PulE family protein [Candidatus Saccharimonadia bacterium]